MSFVNTLAFTAAMALTLTGQNRSIPKTYQKNLDRLLVCLRGKDVNTSVYGVYTIANIELLALSYANKIDDSKSYSVMWSEVLTDFDNNPFLFVKLNCGFGVYDVLNNVFAEMTTSGSNNPFGEYARSGTRLKYVWLNDYYVDTAQKRFIGLRNESEITNDIDIEALVDLSKQINKSFAGLRDKGNEEYVIFNSSNLALTTIYDDGTRGGGQVPKSPYDNDDWFTSEVPYSWYFRKNRDGMPRNEDGICGYVSLSMVLVYNEVFMCSGYFDDEESAEWLSKAVSNNFRDVIPSIADDFPFAVWGDDIHGSASWNIKEAAETFLQGKNVRYSHYNRAWVFGDVTETINHGFPAILFGWHFPTYQENHRYTGMHAIIAYAFHILEDTNETERSLITCHYGWKGDYSEMTIPLPDIFEQGSIYALYNESEHVCKGYFVNDYGNVVRCGCGRITFS